MHHTLADFQFDYGDALAVAQWTLHPEGCTVFQWARLGPEGLKFLEVKIIGFERLDQSDLETT